MTGSARERQRQLRLQSWTTSLLALVCTALLGATQAEATGPMMTQLPMAQHQPSTMVVVTTKTSTSTLYSTLTTTKTHSSSTTTTTSGPPQETSPDYRVPNDPRDQRYQGPWFKQIIILSLVIGVPSLIAFSFVRTRYSALYAPRSKIKGLFSPSTSSSQQSSRVHAQEDNAQEEPDEEEEKQERKLTRLFHWVVPIFKIDEHDVMQNLGIDAIVLLDFLRMGFWLFLFLSIWSVAVLMPVNWWQHGSIDGVAPAEDGIIPQPSPSPSPPNYLFGALKKDPGEKPPPDGPLPRLPYPTASPQTTLYNVTHLASTYLVSVLALRALWRNYQRFVRNRQLHALQILDTIPARTVEVRGLPTHLRNDERKLAEYFEQMGYDVESVAIVHDVKGLGKMLEQRANALYSLERMWASYVGNPTQAKGYEPEAIAEAIHQRIEQDEEEEEPARGQAAADSQDLERQPLLGDEIQQSPIAASSADPTHQVKPVKEKERPTMRISAWNPFAPKVDALDELERRYRKQHRAVAKARSEKLAASASTGVGFVTFTEARSAQILAQTVHYPLPGYCLTELATEPRDVIWSNIAMPPGERRTRELLVSAFVFFVLLFYIPPLAALASFLKPEAIEKYAPWLYNLFNADPRLGALIMNFLPTILVVSFNALLPMVFEWTAYYQGIPARSRVEYSVLKKYYLFLVVSVVFIFLITSTAWEVLTDVANNPMSVLQKLSQALPGARNFSLSYIVLQSLGLVPLQLLQLPTVILRGWQRIFTRTPREHAELNAPPQLYIGTVWPQAMIIFTMATLYSIVSPLILLFGCVYFAVAYAVNKYKILFVFYKVYESQGEAWPLAASRCIWSLALFQLFQLSLFIVHKQALLALITAPLLLTTVYLDGYYSRYFRGLSQYINISSIAEVTRSESDSEAAPAGQAHQLLRQQSVPAWSQRPSCKRMTRSLSRRAIATRTTVSRPVRATTPAC